MKVLLLLCVIIQLYGVFCSPWNWLDDVIEAAKDVVEKAADAGDVTKEAVQDVYDKAKKVAEKAIDAAEEANYRKQFKNAAKGVVDAFEDVATFMTDCVTSLPNPMSDKRFLNSMESQIISSEGDHWMSLIPDSRILSNITIPGTHNTMTYGLGELPIGGVQGWAQNQYASLQVQLRMGVRFLDIRLRHVGDQFSIHHGEFYTGHDFGEVLDIVTEFLEMNRKETVLISYQKEYKDGEPDSTFCEVLESYIHKDKYKKFLFPSYGNINLPTLGEVRGKIVYIDQYKKGCIGFPKNMVTEVNDWSLEEENLKTTYKDKLVSHMTRPASDSKLSLTWCSAYVARPAKCQLSTPLSVSRIVNPWLPEISQPRGIIIMDFPPEPVIHFLYSQN